MNADPWQRLLTANELQAEIDELTRRIGQEPSYEAAEPLYEARARLVRRWQEARTLGQPA